MGTTARVRGQVVMVVEDNEMIAKLVRQIVESEPDLEFRRASIDVTTLMNQDTWLDVDVAWSTSYCPEPPATSCWRGSVRTPNTFGVLPCPAPVRSGFTRPTGAPTFACSNRSWLTTSSPRYGHTDRHSAVEEIANPAQQGLLGERLLDERDVVGEGAARGEHRLGVARHEQHSCVGL